MIWFESWQSLERVAVTGVVAYTALVLFLRLSGKRTLSKLNAFDLVVTIALGSTLATVIVSKETPVADGLLAIALLIALQYVVAWLGVRVASVGKIVKNEPTMLFYDGAFLDAALRRTRVTRDEVLASVRGAGTENMRELRAVVLETDGSLSVVTAGSPRPGDSALASLGRPRTDAG